VKYDFYVTETLKIIRKYIFLIFVKFLISREKQPISHICHKQLVKTKVPTTGGYSKKFFRKNDGIFDSALKNAGFFAGSQLIASTT
jgi:hypothetical protein